MEIILNKEDFLNGIRVVEKITSQKGPQPTLANILIETVSKDRIKFCATDLQLAIELKTKADVIKEGGITLSAKKLGDIVNKLSDKPITLNVDKETNIATISSGKTKFELIGISSDGYPKLFDEVIKEDTKIFEINKNIFNKSIKQTIFSAAQQETASVLGGICVNIANNTLEVVATDGNRLTRVRKEINSKGLEELFIIPAKTLQELLRISSILEDENITISVDKTKILFLYKDAKFSSRLIEGTYPKYQQLIPTTNEKTVILNREEFIDAIDRVSVMVNERTNMVKFYFQDNSLEITTDTPESGKSEDFIDIEYSYEPLIIAFNYKYVLDVLKNMDSKQVKIEMSTNLSATVFKPVEKNSEDENNYVCLIMPVQVR